MKRILRFIVHFIFFSIAIPFACILLAWPCILAELTNNGLWLLLYIPEIAAILATNTSLDRDKKE